MLAHLFPGIGEPSTQLCYALFSLIHHVAELLVVMETLDRLRHSVLELGDLLALSEVLPALRHGTLHVLVHLHRLVNKVLHLMQRQEAAIKMCKITKLIFVSLRPYSHYTFNFTSRHFVEYISVVQVSS